MTDLSQEEYDAQLALLEDAFETYLREKEDGNDPDAGLISENSDTGVGLSSLDKLDQFLTNWLNRIPPISCAAYEQLDSVTQEIYRLFVDYYNPFDLKRYHESGGPVSHDDLDVRHIIVQTGISLYIGSNDTPVKIENMRGKI